MIVVLHEFELHIFSKGSIKPIQDNVYLYNFASIMYLFAHVKTIESNFLFFSINNSSRIRHNFFRFQPSRSIKNYDLNELYQ